MENNNNNYHLLKPSQIEESPDFNALNDAFFNDVENEDYYEKLDQFIDIFINNDKISHLNDETCNNLSAFGDNEVDLNNDLNNNLNDNLMLNKKRKKNKKSVFNFKCEQLVKKLTKSLSLARNKLKTLEDPVKIKILKTSIDVFENLRNKLKELKEDSKNQNKNQNIDKINENKINNVNIEFKSEKKSTLNMFEDKRTKKGKGLSYKTNYPHHTEENAKISKNNCQKVSRIRNKFQIIYNIIKNNSIYENLHKLFDNLNNLTIRLKEKKNDNSKSITKTPLENHKIEESNMNFYFNKLLTTFQVSEGFKEFFHKVNDNEFLKNLYNKYRVILENENLINTICENIDSNKTIPSKYSHTEICKNTNNFRKILAMRGIKSKNTPFEIKIMLDFIPFMYDIFCLLGYVNEIGEITNPKAQEEMKTVMDEIEDTKDLYINYLKSGKKTSFKEYLNENKNKNTKIKLEITENSNFNNSPKSNPVEKPIDLSLQNLNFLNNATKNETAKPNENEINENNNFNININLPELNQPKEQEEQKDLEELEEDLNSSSRGFFFDNNF